MRKKAFSFISIIGLSLMFSTVQAFENEPTGVDGHKWGNSPESFGKSIEIIKDLALDFSDGSKMQSYRVTAPLKDFPGGARYDAVFINEKFSAVFVWYSTNAKATAAYSTLVYVYGSPMLDLPNQSAWEGMTTIIVFDKKHLSTLIGQTDDVERMGAELIKIGGPPKK